LRDFKDLILESKDINDSNLPFIFSHSEIMKAKNYLSEQVNEKEQVIDVNQNDCNTMTVAGNKDID
jgi:hypothetical protein